MKTLVFTLIVVLLAMMVLGGCSATLQIENRPRKLKNKEASCNNHEIKAMTFNIRVDTILDTGKRDWDNRKNIAFDVMAENSPDILGMQEAKHSQVLEVSKRLPEYEYYSVGRANGNEQGEACPIFYRKDRFQCVDKGTFWFSKKSPRICSWVYLYDLPNQNFFYVYNVHLAPISQSAREESVRILVENIQKRKRGKPFIVIGDFNAGMNNSVLKFLQDGEDNPLKMESVWKTLKHDEVTWTRHHFSGRQGLMTDHILFKDMHAIDVKVDKTNVNGVYPSDHFPLIARLGFGSVVVKVK